MECTKPNDSTKSQQSVPRSIELHSTLTCPPRTRGSATPGSPAGTSAGLGGTWWSPARACKHECVRACVHVRVRARVRVQACVRARVCARDRGAQGGCDGWPWRHTHRCVHVPRVRMSGDKGGGGGFVLGLCWGHQGDKGARVCVTRLARPHQLCAPAGPHTQPLHTHP